MWCKLLVFMDRSTSHMTGFAGDGVQPTPPANARQLTRRQRQVLALLVEGATYAQIALALTISVRTAEKHAEAIFRTLSVSGKRALLGMDHLYDDRG